MTRMIALVSVVEQSCARTGGGDRPISAKVLRALTTGAFAIGVASGSIGFLGRAYGSDEIAIAGADASVIAQARARGRVGNTRKALAMPGNLAVVAAAAALANGGDGRTGGAIAIKTVAVPTVAGRGPGTGATRALRVPTASTAAGLPEGRMHSVERVAGSPDGTDARGTDDVANIGLDAISRAAARSPGLDGTMESLIPGRVDGADERLIGTTRIQGYDRVDEASSGCGVVGNLGIGGQRDERGVQLALE